MRGHAQRLFGVAVFCAASALARPSQAQPPSSGIGSPTDLEGARRRFSEALKEEQQTHFRVALDGFLDVRQIRESASVDYHIGVCLEALGDRVKALASYRNAARLAEGDRSMADVRSASNDRIEALAKIMAHLTLALSPDVPDGVTVRIDGEPVPSRGEVVLEPGHHHVDAIMRRGSPFESDVTLPPAGRASLTIPVDPGPEAPPPYRRNPRLRPIVPWQRPPRSSTWPVGWRSAPVPCSLAGGIASEVLRENDIATANRLCPGGGCVGHIDADAQSATNRARVEGPLGIALGAAGLVMGIGGIAMVLRARASAVHVTVSPTAGPQGIGTTMRAVW